MTQKEENYAKTRNRLSINVIFVKKKERHVNRKKHNFLFT